MPAIRDSVFAQESVTTDGGLTIPMCDYAAGDLLFAFIIGDAGTPTLGCSNGIGTWTSLFQRTNTVMFSVWWKYAAASGEGDIVFTSTVNDTYCGWVTSVRDVFQGYTTGSPPVKSDIAQASSSRFAMPTISAQSNSLILMSFANSSSQPSVVFGEGMGITRTLMNGAAEGGSLGWFIQASTATTPSDIFCGVTVVGAGVSTVIECRAPVGGATVLPAYCASDDSIMLLLNPGVAYDGSTVLAATADTNFSTLIGGITCNDATVATAVADVGVDPKGFLGMAGLTNVASATAISGAEAVVPAGKYNIGNSNILGHLRSVTTIASQNMGAIKTTRAVWFGMKSAADAPPNAEYKIWQVHGSDAPYYGTGVIPFVVNTDNTDTRATNGVFDNADVRRYGWWLSGSGVFTGQLLLGSVWKMGTTVIAGGTSTEPIGIEGIEEAATKGKTRWSAIRNGANQLLCLQLIQFGNGGTNPVYLNLNSTAIEFPSKRDVTKKLINYNGRDNSIGILYYAGASDTIIHKNSIISSPSRYTWGLNALSSTAALYDFSGLSVIGAGIITLNRAIIITELTINNYSTLDISNCNLRDCVIINPPTANDSITTNISTLLERCIINVTSIPASNRLLSLANPEIFEYCEFSGSASTGHAIRITTPGTYDLVGNIFTAFGGNGTNSAAIFNDSGGLVTLNILGGGNTPTYKDGAGASTVIVSGVVTVSINVKDISTSSNIQNARVFIEAAAGGGPFPYQEPITIVRSGSTVTVTHLGHGLETNDKVVIRTSMQQEYNGIKQITVTGVDTYTFTVAGTPTTPSSGIASFVALEGLTDVNGNLLTTRTYPSSQSIKGNVRKSSASPYYKATTVLGTIDSSIGLSINSQLIRDE